MFGAQNYNALVPLALTLVPGTDAGTIGALMAIGAAFRLLAPVSAPIQKRLSARRAVWLMAVVRVGCFSGLAATLGSYSASLIPIVTIVVAYNVTDAVLAPAMTPYLASLVGPHERAWLNARLQIGGGFAAICGPMVVLALFSRIDVDVGLVICAGVVAASFAGFALAVYVVRELQPPEAGEIVASGNFSGAAARDDRVPVADDQAVTTVIGLFAFGSLITNGMLFVGVPAIATMTDLFEDEEIGVLMFLVAAGLIASSFVAPRFAAYGKSVAVVSWLAVASIVALLGLSSRELTFACLVALGIVNGIAGIVANTWIQNRSSPRQLTRNAIVFNLATVAPMPVAFWGFGVAMASVGRSGLLYCAIVGILAGIPFVLWRMVAARVPRGSSMGERARRDCEAVSLPRAGRTAKDLFRRSREG